VPINPSLSPLFVRGKYYFISLYVNFASVKKNSYPVGKIAEKQSVE